MKNLVPALQYHSSPLATFIILLSFAFISNTAISQQMVNPLEVTKEFILFTNSDATLLSNENEGPAAIGGNLNIGSTANNNNSNYNVYSGNFKVPGTNIPLALLVNGGVNFFKGSVKIIGNQKGFVKIGQMNSGPGVQAVTVHERDRNGALSPVRITQSGQTYEHNTAVIELSGNASDFNMPTNQVGFAPNSIINFNQAFDELKLTSLDLRNLIPTVYNENAKQGRLKLIDESSNIMGDPYIWNTTDAALAALNEINLGFTPTERRPLIINVTSGSKIDFKIFNMNGFTNEILPYVLWNFPDVREFNIVQGNTFEGSILAPYADMKKTGGNNIQGQVIVNTFYQSTGELHNFPFRGLLMSRAIFDDEVPMPVTLMNINVVKENNTNLLTWQTTDEYNSSHFIVERSQDNKHWEELGMVKALGFSEKPYHYTFSDPSANEKSGAYVYYRLLMVDLDNSYAISRSVSIENNAKSTMKLSFYPNPVSERLHIENGLNKVKSVTLSDLSGKSVFVNRIEENVIDLSNVNQGLHIISVTYENGKVESGRVLVKK